MTDVKDPQNKPPRKRRLKKDQPDPRKTDLTDTTGKLRKLKKQEVEHLRDRFVTSFEFRNMQDRACNAALQVPTRVDLPLGELLNPEMREIIKDWAMTYTFILGKITPQHQFNAQGLEGLVSVENVLLHQALLAACRTGIFRIEIFVPRKWTEPLLCGASNLQEGGSNNLEGDRNG